MRFTVDAALCAGHGTCQAIAPDVFDIDDDGFNGDAGRTVDVAPEHESAAREGAGACPEQAIQVFG